MCLMGMVVPRHTYRIQAIILCHWDILLIFVPHSQSITIFEHTWSQKAQAFNSFCYLIILRARQCGECSLSPLSCLAHVVPHAPSTELHRDMMPLTWTIMKVQQTRQAIAQSHNTAGPTLEWSLAVGLEANPLSNENLQPSLSLPLIGPLWAWNTALRFIVVRGTWALEEL